MRVLDGEGAAIHAGPESCAGAGDCTREALTGVRAGRVLSRVINAPRLRSREVRGAEDVETFRRPHRSCRFGKAASGPARSQTPRMRGNISHGNREIPRPSAPRREATVAAERIVKPKGVRR